MAKPDCGLRRFEELDGADCEAGEAGRLSIQLAARAHELRLSQYLGGVFKLAEIVEREIGSGGSQIETLVADLDDSQNFIRLIEHWCRHQLVDRSWGESLTLLPARLDGLKDAGVLHPGEVVKQLDFFGDRGVGSDRRRTGNRN